MEVVALGDDADDLAFVDDEQRADVASTIFAIASNTVASPSICSTSPLFSSRIEDRGRSIRSR